MTSPRGRALTVFAALFAMLAVSNALKGLRLGGDQTGFVLFGERLAGTPNTVAGLVFGVFLALYATSIWRMRHLAVPLAWLYAAYVMTNLVLYTLRTPMPPGVGYVVFAAVYSLVAIGVSAGAAFLLTRRRADLV